MAGFQGHITTSTTLGIGLGFVGHWSGQISNTSCLLAAGLCSFAGMLPDLDSVKSRQHREIIGFLGAVVAAFTIQRLAPYMAMESATAIACLVYLAIRFGVSWLIRVSTYHRGMFHSIPAAILAGELTFLLITGESVTGGTEAKATAFKVGAVVLGYLSHLLLDEMCSVASNGKIQIKSSLGTAFKWFGKSALANLGMMVLILLLMEPIVNRWQFTENTQIASTNTSTQETVTTGDSGGTQQSSNWSSNGSPSGSGERFDTSPHRLRSMMTRSSASGSTSGIQRTTDLAGTFGTWGEAEMGGTGREMLPPQPMEDDWSATTISPMVRGVAGTLSVETAATATSPQTGLVEISPPTQLEPVETNRSHSTGDSLFSSFRSILTRATSSSGVPSPSGINSPSTTSATSPTSWW